MGLQDQFVATLAIRAAEAVTRAEGLASKNSAALFYYALDEAPWHRSVEQRLAKQQLP